MVKEMFVAMIALALSCSSLSFAQDDAAKPAPMGGKSAALKSFACDQECGFSVRSRDEAEIIDMVQLHAKKGCQCCRMNMSEADVRGMIREEKAEKKEMMMEEKKEKE